MESRDGQDMGSQISSRALLTYGRTQNYCCAMVADRWGICFRGGASSWPLTHIYHPNVIRLLARHHILWECGQLLRCRVSNSCAKPIFADSHPFIYLFIIYLYYKFNLKNLMSEEMWWIKHRSVSDEKFLIQFSTIGSRTFANSGDDRSSSE